MIPRWISTAILLALIIDTIGAVLIGVSICSGFTLAVLWLLYICGQIAFGGEWGDAEDTRVGR